jgi:hypothetical protein
MPLDSSSADQGPYAPAENATMRNDPDRIRRLTFKQDLERIDNRTRDTIREYAGRDKAAISRRLTELDSEWPVERALMAGAGFFVWLGLALGATVNRRLRAVSVAAGAMLLIFALFGWAPPVLIMRRLGLRTRREIDGERIALKILRGDFDGLGEGQPDQEARIERAMKAASQG